MYEQAAKEGRLILLMHLKGSALKGAAETFSFSDLGILCSALPFELHYFEKKLIVWLWPPVPLLVLLLEGLQADYGVVRTQLRADPHFVLNASSLPAPPAYLLAFLRGLPGT